MDTLYHCVAVFKTHEILSSQVSLDGFWTLRIRRATLNPWATKQCRELQVRALAERTEEQFQSGNDLLHNISGNCSCAISTVPRVQQWDHALSLRSMRKLYLNSRGSMV